MKARHPIVVGLDIGTTKVCAIVGEITDGDLNVLGVGTHASKGLRKGVVINIETTVQSIKRAIEEAEMMSGCHISSVYAGISGGHIKSFNSHGMIAIGGQEVTAKDVERVMEAASAVAIPQDREILHVLPFEYIVDDQRGVKDPVGMSGVRLEVNCHIITGATTSAANIIKCCHQVGLHVDDVVFEPLASAYAILSEDERELGAAVIDIGGGTSDIAVFRDGALVHSAVLALGGGHITNDIAHGLRVPATPTAESLKKKFGCAMAADVNPDETVELGDSFGREPRWVARQILCEIIEQRADEILRLIHAELEDAGYLDVTGTGLVLTGGCALLPDIDRLAEKIFNAPVRVVLPQNLVGHIEQVDDPTFAAAVGLTLFGREDMRLNQARQGKTSGAQRVIEKMKTVIKDFF
ncbi:MAG: cell division protein FtsA [Deltaproteobacteria bacterium]|nr:cell division protein FtsA [Deltaproteobacteria bacterium]MCB9478740.1 cell division protein FtsA [Deltaproteobacteria bacterium]MCB9488256.1 cell division protein FtsA [Deltaproteobacteria bacterium]